MQCSVCKGKGLCGLAHCPITARFHARAGMTRSTEYQGAAPSVFIGSAGYPSLPGGPLLIDDSDSPPDWIGRGLQIEEIVGIRARTIRGVSRSSPLIDRIREVALSETPVEVGVSFDRPVRFDLSFDGTVAPVGLSAGMKRMDLLGNPDVPPPVDRVVSDTDLSASGACHTLHYSGVDVYHITRLMSAGLLGRKRHLVPTRWAITAVDDTVSQNLTRRIARYYPVSGITLHTAALYGNRIAVILFPGDWQFEMIERWGPRSLWSGQEESITTDSEGRKKGGYSPISGAYYSARLAVAEYLDNIRKCARVLVIRNVSEDYWAPLGTWVVREATRKAMASAPAAMPGLAEAVAQSSAFLGFPDWDRHSGLFRKIKTQRTIQDFLV